MAIGIAHTSSATAASTARHTARAERCSRLSNSPPSNTWMDELCDRANDYQSHLDHGVRG
jgi:hypothetical protein